MLFGKRIHVSDTLVFQNFIDGTQESGFFDIAELVIDGRSEHTHGGRQSHVGIHERGNVVSQIADFTVEDAVVGLEILFAEQSFQLLFVCV